ncbi:MAG: aspartate aminotransferase family protein [Rhodobiaceae bacterium]|nr:aspartate aminotransferase family protein [Rhodobiaceae bacterium]|tara:strand:+ start:906 stop:2279 length:1374 start_codon:yes stop_codon:yes gene_type:complete
MTDKIKPNSYAALDAAHHFHPYSNARKIEDLGPMVIEKGKGIKVWDDQGNEYIEAMAGLWSVAVGFGEDRLVEAAKKQLETLPYYHSFTHKSHPSVAELSQKLTDMVGLGMTHVHYTNSGSEANDSAMKMIWYYNNALNRPKKKKIISRMKAYHGITIASGSLTGIPMMHNDFDLPIDGVLHTRCPHYWREGEEGETEEEFATRCANELEDLILKEDPETVAAFFGEPVMGAGGLIVPPKTYWKKIQEICKKYDVLIVADEVINGFGRTGKKFACDLYGIEPDFLILSKQITSNYIPMGVVLLTNRIYQAIADNTVKNNLYGSGFTSSGHPVACAVALANIKILEEDGLMDRVPILEPIFQQRLKNLEEKELVGEARGVGLMGAVELVSDKKTLSTFDPIGSAGPVLAEVGHSEGIILRAIGDVLAVCPPLIITEDEINELFDRFERTLDKGLEAII